MSSPSIRRAWRTYKRVTPVLEYCCLCGSLVAILLLAGCVIAPDTLAARIFAALVLVDAIVVACAFVALLGVTGYTYFVMLVPRRPVLGSSALAACCLAASAVAYLIILIVVVAWAPIMDFTPQD